uniref:Uncharacterized protein n=1 Tax=Oryza nivara TaxID=4536 RepID=A0A0E0IJ24_ORYNI
MLGNTIRFLTGTARAMGEAAASGVGGVTGCSDEGSLQLRPVRKKCVTKLALEDLEMEEQMDFFHDESSIHAAGDDQQNVKRGVVMECVRSSRSADR